MSWGDDKNGKGDVFSPVSWDSAAKQDSNWAFAPTGSNESSAFSSSAWDRPSNQTNYFTPTELTPIYGSVENNRSSFFSPNNSDSWAFQSGENRSSALTASDKPSFGFGDSFGFKADHDIDYLENNRSKVFDVFSNTAAELDNYHTARSMKENRDANSWFCAPRSCESNSWAFSKEEPKETSSVFSPTQNQETNSWAFSREEPKETNSIFSPAQNSETNSWAFARSEPTASNESSNWAFSSGEAAKLSSWAFNQVTGNPFSEESSAIVNPFATKK